MADAGINSQANIKRQSESNGEDKMPKKRRSENNIPTIEVIDLEPDTDTDEISDAGINPQANVKRQSESDGVNKMRKKRCSKKDIQIDEVIDLGSDTDIDKDKDPDKDIDHHSSSSSSCSPINFRMRSLRPPKPSSGNKYFFSSSGHSSSSSPFNSDSDSSRDGLTEGPPSEAEKILSNAPPAFRQSVEASSECTLLNEELNEHIRTSRKNIPLLLPPRRSYQDRKQAKLAKEIIFCFK